MSTEENRVNITQSGATLTTFDQQTDPVVGISANVSSCNITEPNLERDVTLNQKTSFATLDHDASGAPPMVDCVSVNNYQQKLTFKKPRP